MANFACGKSLVLVALSALGGHAAPAHLRNQVAARHSGDIVALESADADVPDWQWRIEGLLNGFYEVSDADKQGNSSAKAHEPAAKKNGGDGKEAQRPAPINMQVPEKELKALLAELSGPCRKQLDAMINGRSPGMHTYGHTNPTNGSVTTCVDLEGTLCSMDAQVSQEKDQNGRKMSSTTSVSGKGCLPHSCDAGKDLKVLATFVHLKAKDALPGPDVGVTLRVDCTTAGGSAVEIGQAAGASSGRQNVRIQQDKPVRIHRSDNRKNAALQTTSQPVALVTLLLVACSLKV